MRKTILILMLAIWCVPVQSVIAQNAPTRKQISITPSMGYLLFEDKSYENSAVFGLRLGYDISSRYSLEFGGGFSTTSFDYDILDNELVTENENISLLQLFGDFFYNQTLTNTVTAFASVGMGTITNNQNTRPIRTDVYFAFGGGLKFFIRPDRVIRLDFRQYAPDVDLSFFDPRSGNIIVTPSENPKAEIQKIIAVSLGFSTYF
jgi:hypothetical protein